ncbi:Fur family transcriptional regulator [Microbacterium sp. C7(2022)]|uniref:Fur family transcriptional regulator n=1 Tax=Microbacterium sp. C7(2022) TaxID=2992759 RepID=UPI00237B1860|nr:Fur family transcriptional regulator [Microbacterium sp. C7(2022)]MDE0547308.1 transcriptional repressor [Microbacterium sp. C7(2022)]
MTSTADLGPFEPAALIRNSGLRVTDSRSAVVDALRVKPHSSAEDLYRVVALSLPQTSLQSVYNALSDFVDAGLARRIEPAGMPRLYELRVSDNHHHLVCTRCGAVEDVDCAVGGAPCLEPSQGHGYVVQTAEVTFWGVCPACADDVPLA